MYKVRLQGLPHLLWLRTFPAGALFFHRVDAKVPLLREVTVPVLSVEQVLCSKLLAGLGAANPVHENCQICAIVQNVQGAWSGISSHIKYSKMQNVQSTSATKVY